MDWIEHWLGIAPDHGDGSLETLISMAVVSILAAIFFRGYVTSRRSQDEKEAEDTFRD